MRKQHTLYILVIPTLEDTFIYFKHWIHCSVYLTLWLGD